MENRQQQILSEIKEMMTSIRVQLEQLDANMAELQYEVDPQSFTPGRNYGVRMSSYANGSFTFVSDTAVPSGTTIYMNVLVVR